jgi:hypothetical protein
MRPDGTTDVGAMIRLALMRPRELPALFQTALDAFAARATLLRGRHLLDPIFLHGGSFDTDPRRPDDAVLVSL